MLNLLHCCILGVAVILGRTDAFIPLTSMPKASEITWKATIYFNQDEYCALDDCDGDSNVVGGPLSTTTGSSDPASPLFLHSPNILGSLARLAVAFGPHKIALNQIEDVQVTSYDTSHLDLQVVICEEECLTLLVPVAFPKPCETTLEEECFLDNIHQLDTQAAAQIQQWEWEEVHHEEVSARARAFETLKDTDSYPDWWQKPASLTRECGNLKKLLNEPDFQAEIKALVSYNLATDQQYDMIEVDQVAVADIGPAGIIVKATAHEISLLIDSDNANENAKAPIIIQIPYPFPSPAQDIEGLQAAVLQAVAVSSDFMD